MQEGQECWRTENDRGKGRREEGCVEKDLEDVDIRRMRHDEKGVPVSFAGVNRCRKGSRRSYQPKPRRRSCRE